MTLPCRQVRPLTYGAGLPVAAGTQGILENFPPTSEPNFLTFLTIPSLVFNLAGVNAGSANTVCTGLAIGDSCSPTAGSPFTLTDTAVGTTVGLTAHGIALDGTLPLSDWVGSLSVPITGVTPAQLQAILNSGSFTSPYAAEFVVTLETLQSPVPENGTGALMGAAWPSATSCTAAGFGIFSGSPQRVDEHDPNVEPMSYEGEPPSLSA